jgi:hypothetical protein
MNQIRWLRILAGGFLSELALFAVFIPAVILLGERPSQYVAVAGSSVMPFLFGMWTTRRVKSSHVFQGMLVGAVGILIYVALTKAQPEPSLYIVAHFLKLAGGAAGGYVVHSGQRRSKQTSSESVSAAPNR